MVDDGKAVKTVAIVQARMGSSRLPGKVLKDICGNTMLSWVVAGARQEGIDEVVVATTDLAGDYPIVQHCRTLGVQCYRGAADNVLRRYRDCARLVKADLVVRITADCPAIALAPVDLVLRCMRGEVDYASNVLKRTYPKGLDVEAMWADVLERMMRLERFDEHVTQCIHKWPHLFTTGSVEATEDRSLERWCVDTQEDLERMREILPTLHLS